jgi:hypothetical protein
MTYNNRAVSRKKGAFIMAKSGLVVVFLCICVLCYPESLFAQDKNVISAIPRVDVHSHVGSVERMKHYVKVSEALKDQYGINLAVWIDLNFMRQSDGTEEEYLDAAGNRYKGSFWRPTRLSKADSSAVRKPED